MTLKKRTERTAVPKLIGPRKPSASMSLGTGSVSEHSLGNKSAIIFYLLMHLKHFSKQKVMNLITRELIIYSVLWSLCGLQRSAGGHT